MLKNFFVFILFTGQIFSQIFVSKNLNEGIAFVSDFIQSEEFAEIRMNSSDIESIDSLYLRTLRFYENDFGETLLALTFGTLPYFEMPLSIPIINKTVKIPLPTPKNEFSRRIKNLPSHFLSTSPVNDFGDKDKLAHFFGNAFLAYSIPFINVSEFFSIFVEKFEETFKVEGAFDKRDIFVNSLGKKFGKELKVNSSVFPSEFLFIK
jgi:hypothetical protein